MTRVDRWQLRTRTLHFGRLPCLMGILNVTPDSFSDGGRFQEVAAAVDHGLRMVDQGAEVLDIGGESTRPFSESVSIDEELDRVLPVIEALAARTDVPLSIDTSKAAVAREAVARGAEIINDVTAMTGDAEMLEVARRSGAAVCLMHMRQTPKTMQQAPAYDNVVEEIADYLAQRRDAARHAGIAAAKICLDPGVGFGKGLQHNLAILASVARFQRLGCPVLMGHSRKSFIGRYLHDLEADRTAGTIGVSLALARQGTQILRVHDVAAASQALRLFQAAGGLDPS